MAIPSNGSGDTQDARGRPSVRAGDRVRVRQQAWTVTTIERFDDCALLTLSAVGPRDREEVCRLLTPFDDVERDARAGGVRRTGRHQWSKVCRALIAASGSTGTLRVAPTADVDLLPYQLEPALALLHGHASRVLIADEVGLGKTVQAVLAAAELRARGAAARVLVIAPSGLRDQWADECRARFALPFAVLDQATLRRLRTSLPVDVNPWTVEPLAIASVDYVKRPEVLPLAAAASWDVVIVDEAHGATGSSDRHDAVSTLCRRAAYVILLTATPHNGDDGSFTSLCGLGALGDPLVTFRRTRRETGRDCGRHVHTLRVGPSPPERRMHDALRALTTAMRRDGADGDRRRLLMSVLHKRALSSPYALAKSVSRRLSALECEGAMPVAEQQLLLPLDDGELNAADAPPAWNEPALSDSAEERRLLTIVADAARAAQAHDSKLNRLRRLLRALREPAIVFTEYRDTLLHLQQRAAPRAVLIHGGMSRDERRLALAKFERGGLLLATDAAGEGLNLQRHCRTVVNLELPWNPMRLEQRIGRVDRIGQRRRVHAFHLVLRESGEERLIDRLAARVTRAGNRVGAPDPFGGRTAWTEDAAARLIVEGDEAAAPALAAHAGAVPLTRLTSAAAEACGHATIVRAMLRPQPGKAADASVPTPPAEGAPTLVTWTRNRRTRAALRGRALAIFRTQLTDGDGRLVTSHLSAVLAPFQPGDAWLRAMSSFDVSRLPGWLDWHDASLRLQQQFAATAIARAGAIALSLDLAATPRQAGLFDGRAERRWTEAHAARTFALAEATRRLRRARALGNLTADAAELVLILFPRRALRDRT